jgi:hypothetical protein
MKPQTALLAARNKTTQAGEDDFDIRWRPSMGQWVTAVAVFLVENGAL